MPTRPTALSLLDTQPISKTLDDLANSHTIERIWTRDHTLWKPSPTEIENRLGWLTVLDHMQDGLAELRNFAQAAREA
ncbi:MAG: glucose-6-phosphate isomerase, partial [Nitrospira sp.]|nr:glucose-6-phosphate isomerase [Nitrospira sp.]